MEKERERKREVDEELGALCDPTLPPVVASQCPCISSSLDAAYFFIALLRLQFICMSPELFVLGQILNHTEVNI